VRLLAALAVLLGLAACGGSETLTVTQSETVTRTETETVTETETTTTREAVGLPPRVAEKHAALLAAAESGDYEELRPLIPDRFSYSFGAQEGDAIDYWKNVEAQGGESPIEILDRILKMPYTLYRGTYVWPFAYDKQPDELTAYERRLLGDLADDFGQGTGYLGWRAGIERNGRWAFFIAGD
jgi:hypothetical protein